MLDLKGDKAFEMVGSSVLAPPINGQDAVAIKLTKRAVT